MTLYQIFSLFLRTAGTNIAGGYALAAPLRKVLAEGDGAAMEAERYEHCATVAKAWPLYTSYAADEGDSITLCV